MGLRFRKRLSLGPLRLNLSRSGASLGVKAGPATYNVTRRRLWVNLPGPWFWSSSVRRHPTGSWEHHPLSSTRCVCGARIRPGSSWPLPANPGPAHEVAAGVCLTDAQRGDPVVIACATFTAAEYIPAGTLVAMRPDGTVGRAQTT